MNGNAAYKGGFQLTQLIKKAELRSQSTKPRENSKVLTPPQQRASAFDGKCGNSQPTIQASRAFASAKGQVMQQMLFA